MQRRLASVQFAGQKYNGSIFPAGPDTLYIYRSLIELAKKFKWKRVACVLADDSSLNTLKPDTLFTVEGSSLK